MSKKPLILGIETSCDETAASIITENDKGIPTVLSNIVSSQVDVHKEFGGVVPELAARSHIEKIDWIVEKCCCFNSWPWFNCLFISWFKFRKSFCERNQ